MSHFGVLVLVEDAVTRAEAEAAVEPLLAPYSEHREVDEYQTTCWCVNALARSNAADRFSSAYPNWVADQDPLRAALRNASEQLAALAAPDEHENVLAQLSNSSIDRRVHVAEQLGVSVTDAARTACEEAAAAWIGHHQLRDDRIAAYMAADPAKGQPDRDCETCEGTGSHPTTANPDGHWDWYVVGGRWTGVLAPDYDPAQDPANTERCPLCAGAGCTSCDRTGRRTKWPSEWAQTDVDVRPVATLDDVDLSQLFYAFVTPDGTWHAQGRMGWFGSSSDAMNDEQWRTYVAELAAAHRSCTAIVVDCHT